MPGHKDWYSISVSPFQVDFHPHDFCKLSFRDACDYTAKIIAEDFDNLYLAFSGGYDSELVADVLLRNKIKFTPYIWRDQFSRETDFALHWCMKHGIEPIIFNGNFLDIKTDRILRGLASSFHSKDHLGAINMMIAKLVEKIGGSLITGTGIVASGGLDYPNPMSTETDWQKNEFFVDLLGKPHVGSFFFYTPEILLSYAREIDQSLSTQEAKSRLYGIGFRPKIKPYHAYLNNKGSDDLLDHHSTGSINDLIDYLDQFTITRDPGSLQNPSRIQDSPDTA
jgi:hypothetical protein